MRSQVIKDIKIELKNRLNIDLSNDENVKKYLTFNVIKEKCTKKPKNINLIIPSLLISDLKKLVEINFSSLSEKQKITKLNQLLYIPLILFNDVYKKPDEDKEYLLYEYGYQLSKDLLTSVMSPYDLYKVKNILLKEDIIKEVKWDDDIYFSIYDKRAIKYVLNLKYKNLVCEPIENKYVTKLNILLKNKLAMRSKKKLFKRKLFTI